MEYSMNMQMIPMTQQTIELGSNTRYQPTLEALANLAEMMGDGFYAETLTRDEADIPVHLTATVNTVGSLNVLRNSNWSEDVAIGFTAYNTTGTSASYTAFTVINTKTMQVIVWGAMSTAYGWLSSMRLINKSEHEKLLTSDVNTSTSRTKCVLAFVDGIKGEEKKKFLICGTNAAYNGSTKGISLIDLETGELLETIEYPTHTVTSLIDLFIPLRFDIHYEWRFPTAYTAVLATSYDRRVVNYNGTAYTTLGSSNEYLEPMIYLSNEAYE